MGYSLTARDVSLLKVGNRFVSRIVANAEAVRVAAIAREGVPERKIQVIYNGIQLPAETATRAAPAQTPVVGIVANLNRPVKRVDVFIEAAARVRQKAPPAEFWVVGDGDLRHGLELLARELGIADSVRFLGRRPDVHNLLRRFSVGVLSSDSEGLSNSLIEYMAAALPVVATNVGGNAEVVEDGKTGLLVPPGSPGGVAEAIVSILNDPVRGAAMGDAGRARARERFSLEAMFAKTLALYEETAGCSAGNGGSTAGRAAPGSGNR
jgi:glycosyltransferase involved in cell wall biosynthesis